jgi:hypothetical protein
LTPAVTTTYCNSNWHRPWPSTLTLIWRDQIPGGMNWGFSWALPAPHVPCRQSFALSLTCTARNGVLDRLLPAKTRSPRTPLARVNRTSPAGAEQQSHRHRSTGSPFPATAWKTTPWHECEDLEQGTSLPKSRLSSALLLNLGAKRRSRELQGAPADKDMQQRNSPAAPFAPIPRCDKTGRRNDTQY